MEHKSPNDNFLRFVTWNAKGIRDLRMFLASTLKMIVEELEVKTTFGLWLLMACKMAAEKDFLFPKPAAIVRRAVLSPNFVTFDDENVESAVKNEVVQYHKNLT